MPRHEQALIHEAEGYAKSTGKVGVCLVTSGPGATNTITGLADAHYDSIPLVCFTGQVPLGLIGNDAFQEVDIVGMTRSITKYAVTVRNRAELGKIIKMAFYIARTGKPGPVLIDIPKDIQTATGPAEYPKNVDNPERIKVITPSIGQLPKVETAKFGQEVVEHLFSLTKILRFGGIVLVIFLAMATLFIISNTIRLTVFARRKEVVIMKYVGATDWFIRWPFLLEGMTLGFFGAVIASVCINSLYAGLLERIHATLAFLPLLPTSPLLFYVTIFLLAAGTGIGALGSYISLRKFLRV